MSLRKLADLRYDDEELYDRSKGMPPDYEPPEYPGGMCFCISKDDLEKAGGGDIEPNATMPFSAMGEVTSTFQGRDNCRIEVEINEFAGADGKFFDLSSPACICFQGPELEKVELSGNAERGDMVHRAARKPYGFRMGRRYGATADHESQIRGRIRRIARGVSRHG